MTYHPINYKYFMPYLVLVVFMATYITQVTDEIHHRIIVKKEAWDELKLKKGDYVKVTIEKVKV